MNSNAFYSNPTIGSDDSDKLMQIFKINLSEYTEIIPDYDFSKIKWWDQNGIDNPFRIKIIGEILKEVYFFPDKKQEVFYIKNLHLQQLVDLYSHVNKTFSFYWLKKAIKKELGKRGVDVNLSNPCRFILQDQEEKIGAFWQEVGGGGYESIRSLLYKDSFGDADWERIQNIRRPYDGYLQGIGKFWLPLGDRDFAAAIKAAPQEKFVFFGGEVMTAEKIQEIRNYAKKQMEEKFGRINVPKRIRQVRDALNKCKDAGCIEKCAEILGV